MTLSCIRIERVKKNVATEKELLQYKNIIFVVIFTKIQNDQNVKLKRRKLIQVHFLKNFQGNRINIFFTR